MRLGFRSRVFLGVLASIAGALVLAATLITVWLDRQTYERLERSLTAETRLVAELLSHHPQVTDGLDAEADRLGHDLGARVTLIAADGSVIGDSTVGHQMLGSLGNHGDRPEVTAARSSGLGVSRRYSQTLGYDMLYVAASTRHDSVAVVRLALPLTEMAHQAAFVRQATLVALGVALLAAVALAWMTSAALGRRVRGMAAAAQRYARGDLSRPARDHRDDDLDTVARVLDDSVRELATRADELARDRARMTAILSGMTEGVLAVDAGGRLELANSAARTLLGLDESSIGRHYVESIRNPGIAELVRSTLGGETPQPIEFTPARNPDRSVVAHATVAAGAGSAGVVLVLHDITDLRRVAQVRRDFVANVSHELRTPLTAIRGYVEALGDGTADESERRRFLEIIGRHASRMERLVKDLLRLASLEGRDEPVERAPLAIDALFGIVMSDLAAPIRAKRQRVQTAVEPGAATLVTDAAKLQDALRNILENAVNYAPDGSSILVGASVGADGRFRITVADEGPGIPEADLARVFERFYRVDKARSRESGGTGLGLSIVKHLIELLGGEVRASNQPTGGALFTITLPAGPPATVTGT